MRQTGYARIESGGIAGDQQFDPFPPAFHTVLQRGNNRKRMFFKRAPGKTAFEKERCDAQVRQATGQTM